MDIAPIGLFRCSEKYTYDAARQGVLSEENVGEVELNAGQNFEQALQDLDGFTHIWLIFQFHKNEHWKPLVRPPRGDNKVGVFASRAPYRPNGIGMSCVRLTAVQGRRLVVAAHDLLDGTPILDIKPYIPYADCFPEATGGWTDALAGERWVVEIGEAAAGQLRWLQENGVPNIEGFLKQQLGVAPLDYKRKRLVNQGNDSWTIAYRTWRIAFHAAPSDQHIVVESITSGYDAEEMACKIDPYGDKEIHRNYSATFL